MENNVPNQKHPRQRRSLRGFIIAEAAALGVVLLTGIFVLSARPANSIVITALNVVMFAAAGDVAIIPIFFFAFTPLLPRERP